MKMISPDDDLVQSVSLYKHKHWAWHTHIGPFLPIYGTWFYVWSVHFGINEYYEAGLASLAFIGLFQLLLFLCCFWSTHLLALFAYSKVRNIKDATTAKVVPTANNGSSEMVRISHAASGEIKFIFQKLKYVFDDEKKTFKKVEFPVDHSYKHFLNWQGYEDLEELGTVEKRYGNNEVDMTIPGFDVLFKERAVAPFFVFQLLCVGLWCLDDYWYYSVFTLMMLVMFECTLVNQQLRNMAEIRNMGNKPYMIMCYRDRKWRSIMSDKLVPGDVISICRSQNDNLVPCDVALVRGSCIVDESMLTGESVPQMKEALENVDLGGVFNESEDGRLHVLYGGTKVVQHTAPQKNRDVGLRCSDNGCIAYVLRTGFNTSQGKLLRTILFGVRRVTANNLETFFFILFLLMFAIAAASYVWVTGTRDPNRSRWKLFIECTLILTSVVPPELPIELSLAVNTSLLSLAKLSIFCTEPFRIPFAGKVEICCFDKTGTLTSDNLVVEGVTGVSETEPTKVLPIEEAPPESIQVLATCHSLLQLDDGIVGDPLEKATLTAIDWNLTKGDAVVPKKGKLPAMKIFHRHHFSSALKRMSVITGYSSTAGSSETTYMASVKGAPETLKDMFTKVPDSYEETYLTHARRGARVLALGFKNLGKQLTQERIREMPRDTLEKDLTFAGFVITSSPLKPDSKAVIKELTNASHHVAMITGDNPLTACHVARELRFLKTKTSLILTKSGQDFVWESVDKTKQLPLLIEGPLGKNNEAYKDLVSNHDLCLTGEGLLRLQKEKQLFSRLLPHIKVFARVAPKQKELVITGLRDLGYTTLMCGDGTNDVGALKHANVGVAILSNQPERPGQKKKKKTEDQASGGDSTENKLEKMSKTGKIAKRNVVETRQQKIQRQQQQIQKMLKELEEAEAAQVVKLGDASIAAPFTAKHSSISSINHIIKQGRCTLVTTLQMFKILALNALILAYSQSVLYLEGVKFSDGQATLQGLLLAACFFFISRSKPLKVLSKQRPLPNIFNPYTIITVLLQFSVHFGCLYFLVQEAYKREPKTSEFPDLEKEFEPNLLNSTVYMISMTLQLSTFAINYRGHPYMESLRENKALMYSLSATGSFIALLALGWVPELSEQFGIIDFPEEYRNLLLRVLVADFCLSLILDRLCLFLFSEGKLKTPN